MRMITLLLCLAMVLATAVACGNVKVVDSTSDLGPDALGGNGAAAAATGGWL